MAKFTDEQIREIGLRELAALPLLVPTKPGDEPRIKFTALLPGKRGPHHKAPPGPSQQTARVVKVTQEEDEKIAYTKLQVTCNGTGRIALVPPTERLPLGHFPIPDSDDDASGTEEAVQGRRRSWSEVSGSSDSSSGAELAEDVPTLSVETVAWENAIAWGDDEDDNSIGGDPVEDKTPDYEPQASPDPTLEPKLPLVIKLRPGAGKDTNSASVGVSAGASSGVPNPASNMEESSDDDDDDDDDDIGWSKPATAAGMGGNFSQQQLNVSNSTNGSGHPSSMLSGISELAQLGMKCSQAWNRRDEVKVKDQIRLEDIVLYDRLDTPMNVKLLSNDWLSEVVWDGESMRSTVLVDDSNETYLIQDINDAGCLTREEIESAYGPDTRPGSVRTTEARLITTKKKILEGQQMGKKQYKKMTKQSRKLKLQANGYFRFIDAINDRNNEQGKGVRERLRCKRLPDIPKELTLEVYKPELKTGEARNFYHPKIKIPSQLRVVQPQASREGGVRQFRLKWNESDISALSGPICLFEYMEERPPLLCKVGMASLLVNFYQADKPTDESFVTPTFPGGGRTVVLEPGDRSPFFSILRPREHILALCNDLWVAPVVEHKVSRTDFLLVRKRPTPQTGQVTECSIRNIKSIHLVGQTEPQREVFHPSMLDARSSKKSKMQKFLDTFLDYQIVQLFRQDHAQKKLLPEQKSSLPQSVITSMFKLVNPGLVLKALARVARRVRSDYVLKDNEHNTMGGDLQVYNVCQYDSLQVGLQRLNDIGIHQTAKCDVTRVMHAQAILIDLYQLKERASHALREAVKSGGSPSVIKDSDYERDLAKHRGTLPREAQLDLKAAQYIVDELQLTPWYLTSSYITMRTEEKPKLKLTGLGDPSGRMEAISYLPESIDGLAKLGKSANRRRRRLGVQGSAATAAAISAVKAADAEDKKKEVEPNKKKKTAQGHGGTDADLRGLTMNDGEQILSSLNHTPEEIELLDRWDRIMLVEEYASAVGGADNIPILSKFARNAPKMSEKEIKERDEVQKKVNKLFGKQLQALSAVEEPEFLSQTETVLEARKSKKERRQRQKEKEEKRKKAKEEKRQKRRELASTQGMEDGEDPLLDEDDDLKTSEDESESEVDLPSPSDSDSSSEEDEEKVNPAGTSKGNAMEEYQSENSSDDDSDDDGASNFMATLSKKNTPSLGGPGQLMGTNSAKGRSTGEDGEQNDLADFLKRMRAAEPSKEDKMAMQEAKQRSIQLAKERQIPAPGSWAKNNRRPLVVKRTIIRQLPNGENEVTIEYIKSNDAVKNVQNQIKEWSKPRSHRMNTGLYKEQRNIGPRGGQVSERTRRINERARALGLKAFDEYQENIRKYGPEYPYTVKGETENERRCTACRLPGHTNAAKRCPLFFAPLDNNPDIKRDGDLRLTLKLKGDKNPIKKLRQKGRDGAARASASKRPDRGSSRRQGPVSDLADELKQAWTIIYKMNEAGHFRRKVDKKHYPRYNDVVSSPMYLDKIKEKIEGLSYNSSAEFMADLDLICSNSVLFNGEASEATAQTRVLRKRAQDFLEARKDVINSLEEAIRRSGISEVKLPVKKKRRSENPFSPSPKTSADVEPVAKAQPPSLMSQTSMTLDPFQLGASAPAATPSTDYYTVEPSPSPYPMPSPSPTSFPAPSPSPPLGTPYSPFPAPSPAAGTPAAAPMSSAGASLMDLDNTELLDMEAVEEEVEEEELL